MLNTKKLEPVSSQAAAILDGLLDTKSAHLESGLVDARGLGSGAKDVHLVR